MRVSGALIVWQFRRTLVVTVVATLIAGAFALLVPERLLISALGFKWLLGIIGFIFAHSLALVISHGRAGSGCTAFTYTRGFTRSEVWLATMLAEALGVLVTALVVGLIVWLPVRAWYQDVVVANPFYPGAKFVDVWFPVWPLAGYALLLPMFHYVWIRMAQPRQGGLGGLPLVVCVCAVVALLALADTQSHVDQTPWIKWVWLMTGGTIAAALGWQGWRLHRKMEAGS